MNCGNSELEALSNCPEYTPLPRPALEIVPPVTQLTADLSDGEIVDDDPFKQSSSEDSDCDVPFKKSKPAAAQHPVQQSSQGATTNQTKPRKKYDIWSSSLQEQAVLEEFNKCEVQNVDRSRAVESYFFEGMTSVSPQDCENEVLDAEDINDNVRLEELDKLEIAPSNQRKRKAKKRQKKNRSRTAAKYEDDDDDYDDEFVPRYLLDLAKTVYDSEEDLAVDIANKLYETKDDLIQKVVKTIGKEKAVKYYYDTQTIEEEGGMQIKNQSRRRTPGGVFLFLVKVSSTPDENKVMFTDDRSDQSKKRKRIKAQHRKKADKLAENQAKLDQQKLNDNLEKELPNLLKADLMLKPHSQGDVEVPCPPPSPVIESSNPPPSPATDETPPLAINLNSSSSPVDLDDDDVLDIQPQPYEMELS